MSMDRRRRRRRRRLRVVESSSGNKDIVIRSSGIKFECDSSSSSSSSSSPQSHRPTGGLFASAGHDLGFRFGIISPSPPITRLTMMASSSMKFVAMPEEAEARFRNWMFPPGGAGLIRGGRVDDDAFEIGDDEDLEGLVVMKKKEKEKEKKKKGFKMKIGNASLRKLMSGAIAGAVSRSAVAPLETIRTHLMVGCCGNSASQVFRSIIEADGWKGLYRGNFVNVIRVAPSKAIELCIYDTVKKHLSPKPGEEQPKLQIPVPSIAGAVAGVTSTLCIYPLELLKTRLIVQRGVYKNVLDALVRIIQEEGPSELYRGLTPSIMGVIPYAASNYLAYDTLQRAYKKAFNKEEVGNVMTLLIGSASSAISSSATFPLEVARKHMQAGALNGRQYKNMLHALTSIVENEGLVGLYRGLGPSWLKLIPAAGISFMCYEACKKILVEKQEEEEDDDDI